MTTSEAYVHARFEGGKSRLVGRYRLATPVGERPFGEFQYVGSWLRNESGQSFAIDPENLPLTRGAHVTRKRGLLPGVLADTTPDRWGRRLIEASRQLGSPMLTSADWLYSTGDERVGRLAFSQKPDAPIKTEGYASTVDLAFIAAGFDRILKGHAADSMVESLYRAGRSLGGARPKAVVEHEGALWVAKFHRHDDPWDQCASEHGAMRLAAECGLDVAETRLVEVGPRKVVLVRRFDRTATGGPYQPTAHFLSGLSLLNIDDTSDEGSYPTLAAAIRRHGARPEEDRIELFRRMVFNVLCGNRDDHLKNHALLLRREGWRLSPAFDIVPQPDMHPIQAIGCGLIGGHPTIANCLTRCGEFGLDQAAAKSIAESMADVMRNWRRVFDDCGADEATIRRLEGAFDSSLTAESVPAP